MFYMKWGITCSGWKAYYCDTGVTITQITSIGICFLLSIQGISVGEDIAFRSRGPKKNEKKCCTPISSSTGARTWLDAKGRYVEWIHNLVSNLNYARSPVAEIPVQFAWGITGNEKSSTFRMNCETPILSIASTPHTQVLTMCIFPSIKDKYNLP